MSLGIDYLDSLLERQRRGIFRCKREMFTDPRLFDLEMKHIFEGNWIYLAHESQIPRERLLHHPDGASADLHRAQQGG